MKIYEDNIVNLLRIAEEYILKNIRWRNEITGVEREEIPEIPVAVIREVLANSFAHAIYNGRTSHEICIHPGMITVYSPEISGKDPQPVSASFLYAVILMKIVSGLRYDRDDRSLHT